MGSEMCIRDRNELIASDSSNGVLEFSEADSVFIGGRIRYGNERGALMFEAIHINRESDSGTENGQQYLLGVEYRLLEGFWIQLAVGDRTDGLSADDSPYYSGQLRWAFSDDRLLR